MPNVLAPQSRNALTQPYEHQTFASPYQGIPEAFAQGVYESPGQLMGMFDAIAPYTTPGVISTLLGWAGKSKPVVDQWTGVNELNYNPEDYGASPAVQGIARLGGNIVGDPLNVIPGMMVGGQGVKTLVRNNPMAESMLRKALPEFDKEMVAYHGSPHKFDKFDHTKMGTGEGAQAYGWGTYIAENPKVAGSYQTAGTPLYLSNVNTQRFGQEALDAAKKAGKTGDEAITEARNILWPKYQAAVDPIEKSTLQDAYNNISEIARGKGQGNLYEVDLPDKKIAQMLDWDAPLSEQSEGVRNAFGEYLDDIDDISGRDAYEAIADMFDDGDRGASLALRKEGIPGIKYWDGGSRQAGDGTRNFVVFDEADMKILKRNEERF